MRNYLQRLIERASGDRASAPQRALVPQVVPRREGGLEDPLEQPTIREATRQERASSAHREATLAPITPRVAVRDPFSVPTATPATPARGADVSALAPSAPRVGRVAPIASAATQSGERRLVPPAPQPVTRGATHETVLAPSAPRTEQRDPLVAPARLVPAPVAAPSPPASPATAPERLSPAMQLSVPTLVEPRLEPPAAPAPVPPPPPAPTPLEPQVAPEHPLAPPPPPILSIGRVVVEVTPAAPAVQSPAPIIVRRAAPAAAPAPSTILHRGFGLGQS